MKSPREVLKMLSPRWKKNGKGQNDDEAEEEGEARAGHSVTAAGDTATASSQSGGLVGMGDVTGLTLAQITAMSPAPADGARLAREASRKVGGGNDLGVGVIPAEEQDDGAMGMEMEPPRFTLTMSMSFRPMEENPEFDLFRPFDALEFSFVGGCIGVCRPIPPELASIARATLEMVLPVIQGLTKVRKLMLGTSSSKPEIFIVDRPLKERVDKASPVEDLRLADQMLRLVLVGKPRLYGYWYLQYYLAEDISKILGRGVDPTTDSYLGSEGRGRESLGSRVVENEVILSKIENMTGTRILVAPYDKHSWRRCFLLLGEQVLVERALTLLSGAVAQKLAPTRQNIAELSATYGGDAASLLEDDARLEEIRQELRENHRLSMVEMERDGNCLFRALAMHEFKTEARHKEVRKMVVHRLREAPEVMELSCLVEDISSEEYLRRMAEDGAWGGYTEIMAYSEARGKSIRLFVENDKIGIRPQDIDGPSRAESDRVQLLLYRSHYWMLRCSSSASPAP